MQTGRALGPTLRRTCRLDSVIEFGANIAINLRALRSLVRGIKASAIEINQAAVNELNKLSLEEVFDLDVVAYQFVYRRDPFFPGGRCYLVFMQKRNGR